MRSAPPRRFKKDTAMTKEQKIIRAKVGLLELAKQLGTPRREPLKWRKKTLAGGGAIGNATVFDSVHITRPYSNISCKTMTLGSPRRSDPPCAARLPAGRSDDNLLLTSSHSCASAGELWKERLSGLSLRLLLLSIGAVWFCLFAP